MGWLIAATLGGLGLWFLTRPQELEPLLEGEGTVSPAVPGEDKVQAFAEAIASAEGFGLPGFIPTQTRNPGDLTQGDFGDTGNYRIAAGRERIIIFPTVEAGWQALGAKLRNIIAGSSHVYSLDMTISEMAARYAPDNPLGWAQNVASYLGLTPETTLREALT